MVKENIIDYVVQQTGLSGVQASAAVNAVFDVICDGLRHNETVLIKNFGSFSWKKRNERFGRNLNTGDRVVIPAKFKPVFNPSKFLTEMAKEIEIS